MCCRFTLQKSCLHNFEASFALQIKRLERAGYPWHLITSVSERIFQPLNGLERRKQILEGVRHLRVVPYMHRVSHNVKKVANSYIYKASLQFSSYPCIQASVATITCKEQEDASETRHIICFIKNVSSRTIKIVIIKNEVPQRCGLWNPFVMRRDLHRTDWTLFQRESKRTRSGGAQQNMGPFRYLLQELWAYTSVQKHD